MLNGIDPILIFNFSKVSKKTANVIADVKKSSSLVADIVTFTDLPAIPLYLSQRLTGLMIDSEDKSIEVETDTETLELGKAPLNTQRGLNNTVKIQLSAVKDSIGLTLLTALSDVVFPLVTSKEYSITYLHGAVTVFAGLLHSFNINQNSNNELYTITIELVRTGFLQKAGPPQVPNVLKTVLKSGTKVGG